MMEVLELGVMLFRSWSAINIVRRVLTSSRQRRISSEEKASR